MKQVVCLALLFSLFASCLAQCSATTTYTDYSDVLFCSGSASDPYDTTLTWTISPNNGSIYITFDLTGLESFDSIIIYDGPNTITLAQVTQADPYTSVSDSVVIEVVLDESASSAFTISYVALGDPCEYSAIRYIEDSPYSPIECSSLPVVSSSWTVITSNPVLISFSSTAGITITIRDGASSNGAIIYQGNSVGQSNLVTTSPSFYFEITTTVAGQSFSLEYEDNNFCSGSGVITDFTAEYGTVVCTGNTAVGNIINFISNGKAVEFEFNSLNIGTTDSIDFFDGTNVYGFDILNQVFNGDTDPVLASGSSIYLQFSLLPTSSFVFTYRYVTDPCFSAGVATLTSSSESVSCISVAPSNFVSAYQIIPENENSVTLTIGDIDGYIGFTVYEGNSTDGGLLFSYNGGVPTTPFISSGPMYIEIAVDQTNTFYSYNFKYDSVLIDDPCTISTNTSRYALSGTIACPSLGTNYLESFWEITPDSGLITVAFSDFDLPPGGVINFYDNVDSPVLIKSFPTGNIVKGFTSGSNSLLVELRIVPEVKRGPPYLFSFTYTAESSGCDTSTDSVLINPTGSFGCTGGFGSNLHSSWLISPHDGQIHYEVTELNFKLGQYGLYLNIYDGYNNTGLLLKSIVPGEQYISGAPGYENPQTIEGLSISDAIYVEFFSDFFIDPTQVWEITYYSLGDICGQNLTETLTEPKGVFGCATGLNDAVRSSWLIDPNNDLISLVFLKLDLEDGNDFLYVYEGSAPDPAALIGTYTGSTLPDTIFSTGDTLLVVVETDASENSGGFELAYTSGLGNPCLSNYNATFTTDVGEFGCPNGIQNDIYSYWIITVPTTQGAIVASFTEFSLQLNDDFLYVFDGDSLSAPLIAVLTGSNLPDDIASTGRSLYFLLITDSTIRSQGFYVKYTSVQSDPCQTSQFVELNKNSDSFGCSEGSIARDITSSWLISPDNRNIITLTFSVVNLRDADVIRVYNGDSIAAPLLGVVQHNVVPPFFVSTGSELLVVLETKELGNSVGFRASYTTNQADPCATSAEVTLVSSTGSLGCPNGVRNNVDSYWLIAPLSNNKIEITIEFYNFDAGDSLIIYDGSSISSPIIVTLTGTGESELYTTTNSVALIRVNTNNANPSVGFSINYVTAIPISPSTRPIGPTQSRSPLDFSFSPSPSPAAPSPSQTPVTVTPFKRGPSTSVSHTTLPSASAIIASFVPSVSPSTSVTRSFTSSTSVSPSHVIVVPSASPSSFIRASIVPFSPSANPSVTSTIKPTPILSDVESLTVQLACSTSGATCCNNFVTVWVSFEEKNYPTLVRVDSCIYNDGTVTVRFDQYGSNFYTSEEILRDYWDDAGCTQLDPLSGEECSVSTTTLDASIWKAQILVVDSVPVSPSPLPSYYYYYSSSTSESSVLKGFSSLLLVALAVIYLAF